MSPPLFSAATMTRRAALLGGGLLVAFSCAPRLLAQPRNGRPGGGGAGGELGAPAHESLSGSLRNNPYLDAWIRVAPDGQITVFSGKAELGQGIVTALLQVAAEELDVPPASITMVSADTARTPEEGLTSGSHSMQDSGTAIAQAGAHVRMLLLQAAAKQWGLDAASLSTSGDGHVVAPGGRRLAYGPLAASLSMHVEVSGDAPRRLPGQYRSVGHDLPRIDIPAKVTGGEAYVQDLKLPGMVHARVVRGPSHGTRLLTPQLAAAQGAPGVLAVIQKGDFAAVIAEHEWQAILAMRLAQGSGHTSTLPPLPVKDGVQVLKSLPSREIVVLDNHDGERAAAHTVRATYSRPWLLHASIGPSCAVAWARGGELTIWSHSQGVFTLAKAVAELVGLAPGKVHCIHSPSAGCYGHNGADDVAAEAALLAMQLPGRPIRLQWMREQEFGWEPCGPAMLAVVEASIGPDQRVSAWNYELWSNTHNGRPAGASGFTVAQQLDPPLPPPEPRTIPMPEGGGDRNSNPLYAFANMHVRHHFVPQMPLRVSALRSLGAQFNVFSIESMVDELARVAGADPLDFRLAHMPDERSRAVMNEVAQRFGWAERARGDGRRGSGIAFARYKNLAAYCCVAMEVEVDRKSGVISVQRVQAAIDAGQAVSPDGLRNQTEGGIIQSLSWTMREAVSYDSAQRTSVDWGSYPILRFSELPSRVEVHVMDRPGEPFLGAGEAAQGPASAALANALADAIGVRLRDMPFTPDRVKAALGSAS